jgi:HSP20 family protein
MAVRQPSSASAKEAFMSALIPRDRFDELFSDFFRRAALPRVFGDEAAHEIRIDVTENDKDYQVRAAVPGVKKEDVRITVDGNFVTIATEVRKEKEEKSNGRTLLKEAYFGSSSRGFSLAHEIDEKAVAAKLEDGVLKLTLPKRQSSGARTVTVN